MSAIRFARITIIVALIRFIAAVIDDRLLSAFDFNKYISFFYLPAGVIVLCMLIFGYEAFLGLVLGSFAFLLYSTTNSLVTNALFSFITPSSAAICYFAIGYAKFGRPRLRTWSNYSLNDVFSFFLVYSLLNAIAHNMGIAYIIQFSDISIKPIVTKFIGNITGCLALYIGMSLVMWVFLLTEHSRKMNRIK